MPHDLLAELESRLSSQQSEQQRYRRYYAGLQPLAYASERFRQAFRDTYARFSDNFAKLVVQATLERLTVTGFRFGTDRRNRAAWQIWQANQLDKWHKLAMKEALITGRCPVLVWPGQPRPLIRIQSPAEVVVLTADDPLERAAALRIWAGYEGERYATLYLPDRIEKYVRVGVGWVPREVQGEPWPLPNPLGVVPIVELITDPDIDGEPHSELEAVLPLQDAVNKLVIDMLTASEFAAFRQRWVTGLEIPVDPETGKPIELFKAAVDRVWMARDPNVKFGSFEATDLTPYVRAIETLIQHIATVTRTPPHYLLGQAGTFPSGESLRATETGLVAKAKDRQIDYGEAWEEVMRLALLASGDDVGARYVSAETIWADPEVRTESEHIDALTKLATLGVPREQLWEDAGYTPEQIARFKELVNGDLGTAVG
jgi:hypothetical protein